MEMKRYKTVDAYIKNLDKWQDEIVMLREILVSTELVETVKWGAPCYTIEGKNVVGLAAFKDYFGIWFHQGVFLKDDAQVLLNCQEGKTRGLRQWRFQSPRDIKLRLIRSYLTEAIDLAKQGKEIKPQRGKPVVVPSELKRALKKDERAAVAFDGLTLGKRREFADYISDAKREETKAKRLAKVVPMIKKGVGLNDKYR